MKRLALFAIVALMAGCGENPPPPGPGPATGGTTDSTPPIVATPAVTPGPANPGPTAPVTPSEVPRVPATAPAPATPPVVNPASIPDSTPSVLPTAPVAPAAKDVPIYDTAKDGKTYLFTSVDALNAFKNDGKQQPIVMEKPNLTGSGVTIVIEAADEAQAAQMMASYSKLHPAAPK